MDFVGIFVLEKGILTLLKALAKIAYKPWKLLLLGREIYNQIFTNLPQKTV